MAGMRPAGLCGAWLLKCGPAFECPRQVPPLPPPPPPPPLVPDDVTTARGVCVVNAFVVEACSFDKTEGTLLTREAASGGARPVNLSFSALSSLLRVSSS